MQSTDILWSLMRLPPLLRYKPTKLAPKIEWGGGMLPNLCAINAVYLKNLDTFWHKW